MSRSDEEEVELLKNIWKTYGKPVIAGICMAVVGIFGYKAYQKNQLEAVAESSRLYQNLLEVVQESQGQPLTEQQDSTLSHIVESLQEGYSGSRYAAYGTLLRAREQVLANDLEGASASLQWVLEQHLDPEIDMLARMRMARVMLSQSTDNAQAALDLLNQAQSTASFSASVEAVRGDAYLAMGDKEMARASYQKALDAVQGRDESRPILQFKLDDLAVNKTKG